MAIDVFKLAIEMCLRERDAKEREREREIGSWMVVESKGDRREVDGIQKSK